MRRTKVTVSVLEMLMNHPRGSAYAYELSKMTGFTTGSITPALNRLKAYGILESRMSRASSTAPPRKLFWIVPGGEERIQYWIARGGRL